MDGALVRLEVVGRDQHPVLDGGGQAHQHAPLLPQPKLQAQLHEGQGRVHRVPRPGHQGQEGIERFRCVVLGGGGQKARQLVHQLIHGAQLPGEQAQQVVELELTLEPQAQGGAPDRVRHRRRVGLKPGLRKEQPVPGRDGLDHGRIAARVQDLPQVADRGELVLDQRPAEELRHRQALLADHCPKAKGGVEGLAEDLPGVGQKPLRLGRVAQGRRGTDTHQMIRRGPEARLEPADEQGEVRPLGPVEGVQLVHHQVAQGLGPVVPPQHPIPRADQQVVQHLVIGEQDVRGLSAQGRLRGNDAVRPHPLRPRRTPRALAHEEPDPQPAQRRVGVDRLCEAPGLVIGQGVHGVDHQRLDALAPGLALPLAVVQDRVEEALRLARARPRCNQGRGRRLAPGLAAGEPPPGRLLVSMGRVLGGQPGEEVSAPRAWTKRQADGQIGPLVQAPPLFEEPAHQAPEAGIGGLEARHQELAQSFTNLLGDEAG